MAPSADTNEAPGGMQVSLRGRYVQTPYGWGICIGDEPGSEQLQIALDWRLNDGKRVPCWLRREDIMRMSICAAGACVRTTFGTGVVLAFRPEDGIYQVQLWGPLGRGRNQAFLRAESLLEVISAAVGLQVETPYGTGTCRTYYPSDGKYLVELPWGRAYMKAADVKCPMALTLPLIDRFLDRASDLFKMHSGSLARLREALNGLGLEKLQERVTASASEAIEMASKMWDEWEEKDEKIDVKDVMEKVSLKADEVMADPKMKAVFEAGVARLNVMLCKAEGFDGVWVGKVDEQPRCVIKDAIVTWHWGADTELEIWASDSVSTVLEGDVFRASLNSDSHLVWTDGDTWKRQGPLPGQQADKDASGSSDWAFERGMLQDSLQNLRKIVGGEEIEGDVKDLEQAMNQLSKIAAEDSDVQKIVDEMKIHEKRLFELQEELLQSKAGKVLQEGQERLSAQLVKLQQTELTPQLEQMHKRGERFLTRLSTDKKTKNKALEIFGATQGRIMDRLNDPNDPHRNGIEAWVTSVKNTVVGQLSAHRALLVESLGGLNLQDLDLRQIIENSWNPVDLEKQLSRSMSQGIQLSGIDQSGTELLDYFEHSESVAQLPVLTQTYRSVLSVIDDLGLEVPNAMRGLLEAQATGHFTDVDAWKGAVLKSLDEEMVVQGASELVKHGETLISQFQDLKTSKTVARVMEQFENEDIERTILQKLHDIDTEAMLNTAEGALTNVEDREALVDQLKDICLDFILRILPAINIESVNGHDNGCDWELNDINFSDFHFRKENVHIHLGDPRKPGEELLRVNAWDISAHFKKMKVTISKTEFPAFKQECVADAKAERMSVGFAFKLVPGAEGSDWKIAMSSRNVNMEHLELWVQNTGYAVIINTLSFLFADALKGYASQKIAKHLDEHMDTLIGTLNTVIGTCQPVLMKIGWTLPALGDEDSGPSIEEIEDAAAEASETKDLEWAIIEWSDPGRTFAVRI